jgi:hypothetical protein
VPNGWHQKACDEYRREVEQALTGHFGRALTVTLVVEAAATAGEERPVPPGAAPPPSGTTAPAEPGVDDSDEHIDPSELRDADDVSTDGVDMLLREFGGGELVEEEP